MDPVSAKEILQTLFAYLLVTAAAGVGAAILYWKWQIGKRWFPVPRLRWGRWTARKFSSLLSY